ncbi:PepSY domain-containing protein [Desertibacillus haloalkaliphilus]|uniref:PepSY domain-containing protein n=1 Tax=Desertibacillus haloalkaliphilus TaxID=1328930 RepID=UPI001C257895|nr:PepSY domain-containing protein [Desertibacillus haloalkaliphilus]MBU8905244.1 PepSY domain-containing protein [Desertibacillus haloalkaliphilus]
MSMRKLAIGVGIGLAAGLLIRSNMPTSENLTPEKALKLAKKTLANNVNITGSWIHMIPESLEKNNLNYTVYRGGITTSDQDDTLQYDFLVDAKTGTILELES